MSIIVIINCLQGYGATNLMPVMNEFWGDRYGQLTDSFGHLWFMAKHKQL
jgi:PhnB protein